MGTSCYMYHSVFGSIFLLGNPYKYVPRDGIQVLLSNLLTSLRVYWPMYWLYVAAQWLCALEFCCSHCSYVCCLLGEALYKHGAQIAVFDWWFEVYSPTQRLSILCSVEPFINMGPWKLCSSSGLRCIDPYSDCLRCWGGTLYKHGALKVVFQ